MIAFSALLLAAGRSTRMGRDKALLDVGTTRLWQRQRDVLVESGASEVLLSARPEQSWVRSAGGFTAVLHDAVPGCGPIMGITAGLERAFHPLLAVLAVDLPGMSADWFKLLLTKCTSGRGAIGRRDGHFEPLAAIFPREIMWLFWEAIARAEYALQPVLTLAVEKGLLHVHDIAPGEEPLFANWNSMES